MSKFFIQRWSQGVENGTCAYIDKDTICFKCGLTVKFVTEDGATTIFNPPMRSLALLAVHPYSKVFAVSESAILKPKVYIFDHPFFKPIAQLDGAGTLDISGLTFSHSDYLCTTSGVPDFQIMLWNYVKGEKLCSASIGTCIPTSLSFCPTNWRHICMTDEYRAHVWMVEQCDNNFHIKSKVFKMPAVDMEVNASYGDPVDESRCITRASTHLARMQVEVPKTSISGLYGKEYSEFEEFLDTTERVICVTHTWTVLGDLYLGCHDGHLIRIDMEKNLVRMIINPLDERFEQDIPAGVTLTRIALSKAGIYIGDSMGILRLVILALDGNVSEIQPVHQLDDAISDLTFNSTFTKLAVGSGMGHLDVLSLTSNKQPAKRAVNCGSGKFVGVGLLTPGTDLAVTVRNNNDFQIWHVSNGELISTLPIPAECVSLITSPVALIACVGTIEGFLICINCSNKAEPKIVKSVRLHEAPLNFMTYDPDGFFIITACDDGYSVVVAGRPSDDFKVLGYTDLGGDVKDISSVFEPSTKLVQTAVITRNQEAKPALEGANKIYYFELPTSLIENANEFYATPRKDFNPTLIKKMNLNFTESGYGCALMPGKELSMYTVDPISRKMQRIFLPNEPPKRAGNKASFLTFESCLNAMEHDDPEVRLTFSPDYTWLTSFGVDGHVRTIDINGNGRTIFAENLHDVTLGGIQQLVFTGDSTRILSCGYDSSLVSTELKMDPGMARKCRDFHVQFMSGRSALIQNQNTRLSKIVEDRTLPCSIEAIVQLSRGKSPSNASSPEPFSGEIDVKDAKAIKTWVQRMIDDALAQEDKKYSDVRKNIRNQLKDMKNVIHEMVSTNQLLPELEQLERQEFELDVDEQNRIIAETDAEVAKIRENIEMDNLSKQFIHDVIKRECWDAMKVKGRSLCAFNTAIEVHNFPMKAKTPEEIKELEDVIMKRKIELADLKDQKEHIEILKPGGIGTDDAEEPEDDEHKDNNALSGGFASLYGGQNDLMYSQFELHTRDQKMKQIVLLQDTVYRIKETFNKEFDEVFQRKEQEVAKIRDKNTRIHKILRELDMMDQAQPDPDFSTNEKPERLLVVEDSEVTVERYLTPEQRKKLEEDRLAEEERKRRERADNWRERGLDDMMGGVLEVKKEDQLKKDVPKPAFMTAKPEEEWTEDEKKVVAEYERKVKELNEERDKYRKQLEAELKKLTGFIEDGKLGFDDFLAQLFGKKLLVQMAVFQEELKILRHRWSLLVEEELIQREKELSEIHASKSADLLNAQGSVMQARKIVDKGQESYDIMCAEDKLQEKNFKKEFHDTSAAVLDILSRAYRRRPKRNLMAHTPAATADSSPYNPYAERPSTARQHRAQRAAWETAIDELDQDRREDLEGDVWERLCRLRRKKILKELDIKQRALEVADMNAFLQRRQEDEGRMKSEVNTIEALQDTLQEDRQRFYANLEIQLLVKQGQVEVEVYNGFIHDFTDSLLLHRSVVEDVNSKIRGLGAAKVQHMMEEKEFKKKFIHIEWELRRMMMEYQDLENKMKDIRVFKISREVQRYLASSDYDGLINNDIHKMEQAIQLLQKHQERIVDSKKDRLKSIKDHKSKKMEDKNGQLKEDLTELNVCVNERLHISEGDGEGESSSADKRYRQILQRQKLVDLAKAQAKEVAVLRAEVERLRMRTFPALVQNK